MFSCHVDMNMSYFRSLVLIVYGINNLLYVLSIYKLVGVTDRHSVMAVFDYQLRQSIIDNQFFLLSFE